MVDFGNPEEKMPPRPNFVFPVDTLYGDDFRLEPYEGEKHTADFWKSGGFVPELYSYMLIGPYTSREDFDNELPKIAEADETIQLYAIITDRKSKERADHEPTESLAGVIAYNSASHRHLKIDIGPIIILPRYQGTGLSSAVVELMIQHAFKDASEGGWGIRKVQWLANAANKLSIKLAERLKFRYDGLLKWDMVMRDGQAKGKIGNGRPLPPSSNPGDVGRDSVLLSRCWDD